MSIFYDNPNHREKFFILDTVQDIEKTTTSVPIVVILPSTLGPIFCGEGKRSWELHRILKSWVEPKYREVKQLVRPIIEWLICSCVKGRNEDTSAAQTDTTVVTLPYQKLKYWQKLWIEGTIGKWLEAQRVAATHINEGFAVAATALLSVSQAESFLCELKTLQ